MSEQIIQSATHRPTPWTKVERPAPCSSCQSHGVTETAVIDARGREVWCDSAHESYGPEGKDMEFVLCAVNNHDDLLSAATRLLTYLDDLGFSCPPDHTCLFDEMRAAIARAKGEQP